MPCYVMLCYVMLCYVMLCYVMLCYAMLCYVMLCYVMLRYKNTYFKQINLQQCIFLKQTYFICIIYIYIYIYISRKCVILRIVMHFNSIFYIHFRTIHISCCSCLRIFLRSSFYVYTHTGPKIVVLEWGQNQSMFCIVVLFDGDARELCEQRNKICHWMLVQLGMYCIVPPLQRPLNIQYVWVHNSYLKCNLALLNIKTGSLKYHLCRSNKSRMSRWRYKLVWNKNKKLSTRHGLYIYIFVSSIILKSKYYMNTINIQRTVKNETYIQIYTYTQRMEISVYNSSLSQYIL